MPIRKSKDKRANKKQIEFRKAKVKIATDHAIPNIEPTRINMIQLFKWGIFASGWLAALLMGFLDLPGKINSFARESPDAKNHINELAFDFSKYNGRWTNDPSQLITGEVSISDGSEESIVDNGTIQLTISVDNNGVFSGEFYGKKLEDTHVYSRVLLEGEIDFGDAKGIIWDFIDGQKAIIAKFSLEPINFKGHDALMLKPLQQNLKHLPDTTILWQSTASMADGQHSPNFLKQIDETINKSEKVKPQ